MSKIEYYTMDPCNVDISQRFTGINGNRVLPKLKVPRLQDLEAERVAIDLDHMPSMIREDLIEQLATEPAAFPVHVHSTSLSEEQVDRLTAARVRVHEGILDSSIFK